MDSSFVLFPIPLTDLMSSLRDAIREELKSLPDSPKGERIVSEKELCEHLNISGPTAIRYRKKGKIPFMKVGSSIRYDLNKVFAALEKQGKAN
jgi:hypothetical protein